MPGTQCVCHALSGISKRSKVPPATLRGPESRRRSSDAALESANQADFAVPVSAALAHDEPEVMVEPEALEVDLRSNAIVAASLFDQPGPTVDDIELAQVTSMMHGQQEIAQLLDERVKRRLRVDVLPKDRAASSDASGHHPGESK